MEPQTENRLEGDSSHQSWRAVLRHIGWSALQSWGERFTTLVVFLVLARLLAPDQIGVLAFLMAINSLILLIADGALSEWLIRCESSTREQELIIFTLQGLIGIAFTVIVCLVGAVWGRAMIGRSDAALIMAALSLTIPLGVMAKVPEALLRRRFAFKQMTFRSLVVQGTGGVVGISCALAGLGVWSLVVKQLLESTGYLIITLLAAKWRMGFALELAKIKEAIRFAAAVFSSWIFDAISQRADSLIVGSLAGATVLGYYSIALRIIQVISEILTTVVSRVALVHFAVVARRSREELAVFYSRMLQFSTRLLAPLIAVFAALAPVAVGFVFGARWSPAATPLAVLCIIPLCTTITCFACPIVQATGHPKYAVRLTLVAALFTIVGAAVGCGYGLVGVAIGVAARMVVVTPLAVYFESRVSGVSCKRHAVLLLPVVLEAAAGFAAAFVLMMVTAQWPTILRLFVAGLGGVVAGYGALCLVLPSAERRQIWRRLGAAVASNASLG